MMQPIQEFLEILPNADTLTTASGLLTMQVNFPVKTATVLQVGPQIKNPPVKAGDKIVFSSGRLKCFAGQYFIKADAILALV